MSINSNVKNHEMRIVVAMCGYDTRIGWQLYYFM